MATIFDTHAHYNDEQFDADRDELLRSMAAHNVGTIITSGASYKDCRDAVRLAHAYPFLYASIGLHPDNCGDLRGDGVWEWLTNTAKNDDKVVAIGEIGLDYHWNVEDHDYQKECFVRQLDLARNLSLPVVIHSRDAAQDTMDLIRTHAAGMTGSLHCYSYSPEMAAEYVKLGWYIGVGGVVTFKNGKKLKAVVERTPIERILLETDCPYLAPVPYRGKRNDSRYIDYVADTIAQLKGMTKEDVIRITRENAEELFGVPVQATDA